MCDGCVLPRQPPRISPIPIRWGDPIGILDKLGDIGNGILDYAETTAKAAIAIPSIAVDLATEVPNLVTDQSWGGFFSAAKHDLAVGIGRGIENTIGAHGVIGAPIGQLPSGVRNVGRDVLNVANLPFTELNRAASTVATLSSFAAEHGNINRGGWSAFLDGSNWRDAWNLSKSRSFGEAVVLAATTRNIEDPAEVTKAMHSEWYGINALAVNLSLIKADPLALGLKSVGAFREGLAALNTTEKVNSWTRSAHMDDLYNEFRAATTAAPEGKAAAHGAAYLFKQISRSPAEAQHAQLIAGLASGAETRAEFGHILGAVANSPDSLTALWEMNPKVAGAITDFKLHQAGADALKGTAAGSFRDEAIANDPYTMGRAAAQEVAEVDAMAPTTSAIDLLSHEVKARSLSQRWQDGITSSNWYRDSRTGKVTQLIRNTTIPKGVNPDNANAADGYATYLTDSRAFTPAEQASKLGEFINSDASGRAMLVDATRDQIVTRLADQFGVPEADVTTLRDQGRGALARYFQDRVTAMDARRDPRFGAATGPSGKPTDIFTTEDGVNHVKTVFSSQTPNWIPFENWSEYRRGLSKWGQLKAANPGFATAIAVPEDLMTGITKVWKASTLGRYATGLRIAFANQLLALGQVGVSVDALTFARHQWDGVGNYSHYMHDRLLGLGPNTDVFESGMNLSPKLAAKAKTAADIAVGEGPARAAFLEQAATEGFEGAAPSAAVQGDELTTRRAAANQVVRQERAWKRGAMAGAAAGTVFGPIGTAGGALGGSILSTIFERMSRSGLDPLLADGRHIDQSFGAIDPLTAQIANMRTSGDALNAFLSNAANNFSAKAQSSRSWDIVGPDSPFHGPDWEHYVNNVIAQDPVGKLILKGIDPSEIAQGLVGTAEGQKLLANHYLRAGRQFSLEQAQEWVDNMVAETHNLTGGLDPRITKAALRRRARASQLDTLLNDGTIAIKPNVAGEIVMQAYGRSPLQAYMKAKVSDYMNFMTHAPTEHLVNNPFWMSVYDRERARQVDAITKGGKVSATVSQGDLNVIDAVARRKAIHATGELMFDLADHSEISQMMRNIAPFFGITQHLIAKWTGLAVENPAYVQRLRLAWEQIHHIPGPPDAGQPGVPVPFLSNAKDFNGQTVIRMRLPGWAKALAHASIFGSAFDDQGLVTVDPRSLTHITSGSLGWGPLVQYAAAEVAKAQPNLEKSVDFINPYGAPRSLVDAFMPTWGRRAASLQGQDADAAYANNFAHILTSKLVKMNQGEIPLVNMADPQARAAFIASVHSEADQFSMLRLFASVVAPVTTGFNSPYQPYIDAYQALRTADPATADETFLAQYGPEFFPLTERITKNISGLPPTLAGAAAEAKFGKLVAAFPGYGGVITGPDAGGSLAQFSSAVYRHQLETETSPGSGVNLRQRLTPEQMATDPGRREGWISYSRIADGIDAALAEQNLPSINVKGAEKLKITKQVLIAQLATRYPTWYQDFATHDDLASAKTVAALSTIADDPLMVGRDDMAGMREYAKIYDAITATLASRKAAGKSGTITAKANADLAATFDVLVQRLRLQNLAFADLHARYLDRAVPTVVPQGVV